MRVFTNNIVSVSDDGTVDEFVFIWICRDKVKTKLWIEATHKWTTKNGTYDVGSKDVIDLYREYFHVFADYLIADA